MRKIVFMLAALLSMSVAIPTFAEMTATQKDECVLVSRNCKDAVDDIQTQIKRINKEIEKGTAVYTAEELKKLQQKLAEVKEILDGLNKH
ncbi:hypothetical protein KP005_19320 [Geomonas nitrogeniifigens]|uniref:Uncharacterized protein n=1 Tax=Geomonas diazotrophica TaxID=2843197 RepID=A0ABX8JGK5_9BACT|nr:hypothetical protein [Geomonas nitrogeniifigens]QWV97458.1 hypothetical protein KP005_19320 [Geomonas nitrogeniifigens]